MPISKWILCQYTDEGEMTNQEFVDAPDDSYWWVDGVGACHTVMMKCHIYGYPDQLSRVWHPNEQGGGE